jgi:hypothetical protein
MMILMLPLIFGVVAFAVASIAIFMLLARFGLLPGVVFRTYRFTDDREHTSQTRRRESARHSEGVFAHESEPGGEASWYQEIQDGEVIILPETALKKANGGDKS